MDADKEAKRRARRERAMASTVHGDGDNSVATSISGSTVMTPGAYQAFSRETSKQYAHKNHSKSNRRSKSPHRRRSPHRSRSPRPHHDDKEAKRRAKSSAPSKPPSKPGAERSSSNHRTAKERQAVGENEQKPPSSGAAVGGEAVAQAVLVEEDDGKQNAERLAQENQRFRDELQQENERQRRKIKEENERMRLGMEEEAKREQEKKEEAEKKARRRQCVIMLVILVLIGGGVGAYFGIKGSSSETPTSSSDTNDNAVADPTSGLTSTPVTDNGGGSTSTPTVTVTPDPTVKPTDPPTEPLESDYEAPTGEDCEAVSFGLARPGQDDIPSELIKNYQVILYVETSRNLQELIPSLKAQINRVLVYDLVGCNDVGQRRLRLRRKLPEEIPYVFFNVDVTIEGASDDKTCGSGSSSSCRVMDVKLRVFLRAQELEYAYDMILDVFETDHSPDHANLAYKLGLESTFQSISLHEVLPLDPTSAPTNSPTKLPSASPSTGRPSLSPSGMPSKMNTMVPTPLPTTPRPTLNPTARPTTPQPTLNPSPRPPRPTLAPIQESGDCFDVYKSYFDMDDYQIFEGGSDSVYTLSCGMLNGNQVIALQEEPECTFICVADHIRSEEYSSCQVDTDFMLKGNFRDERIFFGVRSESANLECLNPLKIAEVH